ncbi:MAG: hypothetical protein ACOYD3_00195 [Kiritimatiellia bacterium]
MSATLRPHTSSLRFVESPDTEIRCNENGPAVPGEVRGAFSSSSSSSIPGTAVPAGTAGTAGGWRLHRTPTPPYDRQGMQMRRPRRIGI